MTLSSARASDTQQDSSPAFAGHEQHEAVLSAARAVARERDGLAAEVTRLRREADAAQQRVAMIEDGRARATRATGGAPRELVEAREAVEARDREIRRLRDASTARERLFVDLREKLDAVAHERSTVEARLAGKERLWGTLEARLAQVQNDLATERRAKDEAMTLAASRGANIDALHAAIDHAKTERMQLEAHATGLVRGAYFQVAEARADSDEAIATAKAESAAAITADRASRDEQLRALQTALDEAQADRAEIDGAMQAECDALRTCVSDQALTIAARDRVVADARTQNEWLARQLGEAMGRVAEVRRRSEEEVQRIADELGTLARLVAQLTCNMVGQRAELLAARDGRTRTAAHDLDEALAAVSDQVPESIAEQLWGARETLHAQFTTAADED